MNYNEENILSGDAAWDLFGDDDPQEGVNPPENTETEESETTTESQKDVSADDLFGSESVGSEDNKEVKGTESDKEGSSPNDNFYSSIANALVDEGTFQFLDKESIDDVKDVEDFAELFKKELEARLDATQRRVNDALNYGVEPSAIKEYERRIDMLDGITDEAIEDESDSGDNLRKQLIYTDAIQRGMSDERAKREVKKSIDAGSDIDDAKEALASCKTAIKKEYDDLLKQAESDAAQAKKERDELAKALKKDMTETEIIYGDLKVDKLTRQKAYDSISKPIYRDDSGNYLTAVQKYQKENPTDFIKNVGLLYTLTDGFKNINKLVADRVKKEKKQGLRQLEQAINSTKRNADGSLKLSTGSTGDRDPNSYFGKGVWKLDI